MPLWYHDEDTTLGGVLTSLGNRNSLFYGILSYLQADGHARHEVRSGWQITEKGVSLIED